MASPLLVSPKLITVDRSRFTAYLWALRVNRYVKVKRYQVAIGRVGYETPPGAYFITRKDRNPKWVPPDSDWVTDRMRDASGKPLPIPGGDPRNPLRGAFIALSGDAAIGFHGVPEEEYDSIGKAASHGCLRMRVPDVMDLFKRVPKGTPVFIYDGRK